MILWLLTACATTTQSPCRDLPELGATDGLPPDAWPTYQGRCLDQGPKKETLLDRARRCVEEEPEDPAPIVLLGHIGDESDVPALEALALRGMHADPAVDSLALLDPAAARPALVRIACHAHLGNQQAVSVLAAAPRPEEWTLYAKHWHGDRVIAEALGGLGLPEGREVLLRNLESRPELRDAMAALAQDRTPEGVRALLDLRADPVLHARIVQALPADHPSFGQVIEEAAADAVPEVRAAVARSRGLGDARGVAALRQVLADPDASVRAAAARTVAADEERFEDLDATAADLGDPERAIVYHVYRVGREDPASVEPLRSLREVPATRWEATRALLGARRLLPPEELNALAQQTVDDEEAPEDLRSVAQYVLGLREASAPIAGEPERTDFSSATPRFSRERVSVRDAKRWAKRARAALNDESEENDAFGLAVLPWVGDDTDIDRLAGTSRRGPRTRPLADLGTPAALDRMTTSRSHGLPWAWARSDRAWEELVAIGDVHRLRGIVRPEVYEILLRDHQERASRGRRPTDEPEEWTIREQRTRLQRRFQDTHQLPTAASLAAEDERTLASIAQHMGHKWILLDALPSLPEAQQAIALEALVQAHWRGTPPEVVVEAARASTSRGAWRVRIAIGETDAVLEAMRTPRGRASQHALAAVVEALSVPEPPSELLDPMVAWVRSGEFPPMSVGALLGAPALRPVLKEAVLAGELPLRSPCDALRWVQDRNGLPMDDGWIIDTLMQCGRQARLKLRDRVRLQDLQDQMLERELHDEQLATALSLDQTRVELVLPHLDNEEIRVRNTVLGTMQRTRIPEGESARVVGWAAEESREQRAGGGGAMRVLLKHDPEAALPLLTARVAAQDDGHATAALKQIGTDEAFAALIPVLERGTSRRLEEIGRWVKEHGGPVYEANRALVDGLVTPTWKRTP